MQAVSRGGGAGAALDTDVPSAGDKLGTRHLAAEPHPPCKHAHRSFPTTQITAILPFLIFFRFFPFIFFSPQDLRAIIIFWG